MIISMATIFSFVRTIEKRDLMFSFEYQAAMIKASKNHHEDEERRIEDSADRSTESNNCFETHRCEQLTVNERAIQGDQQEAAAIRERYLQRSNRVAKSAMFYCAGFLFVWFWGLLNRLYEFGSNETSITLMILTGVFYPLQGAFNYAVFMNRRKDEQKNKNRASSVAESLGNRRSCSGEE